MTKRLLIDASHAEETRVVVLDGNRLEDFDVETQSRRQLKGNIYLAKVVRVEPSLQAAFVEYGGNRHGFLAFGEIHPDYYQIPVADRQRLLAMQEEEARAEEEEDDDEAPYAAPAPIIDAVAEDGPDAAVEAAQPLQIPADIIRDTAERDEAPALSEAAGAVSEPAAPTTELGADTAPEAAEPAVLENNSNNARQPEEASGQAELGNRVQLIQVSDTPAPETLGGDADSESGEDIRQPRQPSRFMRSYKIQEVIRRRQILLIQVVKEERGTKGAALTTYISLAGRYCVLMPNSPRGGGISRKITSAADRRRLKEVTAELEIPRGMGLIVRTAGAARPKAEIKRDGEYLLRLWDDIREQTMRSIAPALIYEEASLIKRAIRDVYSRDVDELLVDGEEGWRAARDYMRMLMPTHVKKVQLWPQNAQPLFAHQQVESMLDAMLNPTVQLRSGGYLVINQTEALVAIDVNSGRSTRERGIEETALRTNLEAAEEAARQLRLRDLAGLIVIDFIDMESKKHNAMVERRMADALKHDRARIQVGHISHFGLLELSRQRLRPSLAETSLNICPHCGGTGHVRSTESAALHVLREIEEEGGRRRAAEILVHVASATALYILNHKRQRLTEIEQRYGMIIRFAPDETLLAAQTRIDRVRAAVPSDLPPPVIQAQPMPEDDAGEADISEDEDDVVMAQDAQPATTAASDDFTTDADHVPGETAEEGERRRKRRRRRRRGGRRDDSAALGEEAVSPPLEGSEQPDIPDLAPLALDSELIPVPGHDEASEAAEAAQAVGSETVGTTPAGGTSEAPEAAPAATAAEAPAVGAPVVEAASVEAAAVEGPGAGPASESTDAEAEPAPAKRGRRGGRRRRKPGDEAEAAAPAAPPAAAAPGFVPYVGPTPADPFALSGMDIFDALEQAELQPKPEPAAKHEPASEVIPAKAPVADAAVAEAAEAAVAEAAAPVIKPVLIGSGEAVVLERKKGWWRR